MSTPMIYLAGPIEFADERQRRVWRDEATFYLAAAGISVSNPLGKDGWPDARIVAADLEAIDRADAVLAWLPMDPQALGTTMEVFYASYCCRKQVIVWGRTAEQTTPWLRHFAMSIFPELDAALRRIVGCRRLWDRSGVADAARGKADNVGK